MNVLRIFGGYLHTRKSNVWRTSRKRFCECSVNVRTTFSECSCKPSINIWCCLQANVQRTFARTFGKHNANVHTIFGEYYLASWVAINKTCTLTSLSRLESYKRLVSVSSRSWEVSVSVSSRSRAFTFCAHPCGIKSGVKCGIKSGVKSSINLFWLKWFTSRDYMRSVVINKQCAGHVNLSGPHT